jgi:hypothetical protein
MKKLVSVVTFVLLLIQSTTAYCGVNHGTPTHTDLRGQVLFSNGAGFGPANTGLDGLFANLWKGYGTNPNGPTNCDPTTLDANGFPKSTASLAIGCQGVINFIPSAWQAGPFVMKITGKIGGTTNNVGLRLLSGASSVTDSQGCVSGSFSVNITIRTPSAGVNCRVLFTPTTPSANMTWDFDAGGVYDGTLSNIELCYAALESVCDSIHPYNPDTIAAYGAINPRGIRFVNLEGINNQTDSPMVANYADMRPASYMSYGQEHWDPNKLISGGTTGTTAYTNNVQFGSSTSYVDGMTIHVLFSNASTGAVTFSLVTSGAPSGIGAVPIYTTDYGLQYGTGGLARNIGANAYLTMVYSKLFGGFLARRGGFGDGVPLSVQVDIANQVNNGVDAWINLPFVATPAMAGSIATYTNTNLIRTTWFEWALEDWNGVYGYTQMSTQAGVKLGFPSASGQQYLSVYGLIVRQLWEQVGLSYGAGNCGWTKRCMRVEANQESGDVAGGINPYALQGADLNGSTYPNLCTYYGLTYSGGVCINDPGYNTAPNRPFDFSDVAAYAIYYSGANLRTTDVGYLTTSTASTINAAANQGGGVTRFGTSSAHGLVAGYRVFLGSNTTSGLGTNFTGDWAVLNQQGATVTNVSDSTHFDISYDSSAFAAYSSNGGSGAKFTDDMVALKSAADSWAAGNFSTGNTTLDGDIRAGTNYGVLGSQTVTYHNANYFPPWNTAVAGYSGGQVVVNYGEGGMEATYPTGTSFTGSISGTTLSGVPVGSVTARYYGVSGSGVAPGTTITTTGCSTTCPLNSPVSGGQTVASTTITISPCPMLGLADSYCGATGSIANLLGTGTSPSANSYKKSALFRATWTCMINNMLAQSKSKIAGQYEIFGGDRFSLGEGSIYDGSWSSQAAMAAYPLSGAGSPGC